MQLGWFQWKTLAKKRLPFSWTSFRRGSFKGTLYRWLEWKFIEKAHKFDTDLHSYWCIADKQRHLNLFHTCFSSFYNDHKLNYQKHVKRRWSSKYYVVPFFARLLIVDSSDFFLFISGVCVEGGGESASMFGIWDWNYQTMINALDDQSEKLPSESTFVPSKENL